MRLSATRNHTNRIGELIKAERLSMTKEALETIPDPKRHPGIAFDRIEGMLLGLAIGDALGNTSESLNPSERRVRCGEIRD